VQLKSRPIEEQRALNVFSARSLEYLVASESQVKALVELVFSEATNSADDEQFLRAMRYCAFCSAERRTFVRKLLLELIIKTFRKAEQPSLGNLFSAMSTFAIRGDALAPSSLFPDDLQKEAQSAVRRMVVDRAPTSDFFALVAWSWFGLISEDLLRRHGLALYYNAFLEGNHYGVDGLTNLVLAASDRYARSEPFTQVYAAKALATIARVGYAGGPLVRDEFSRVFGSAPLEVWHYVLKHLRKTPEACAGAFLIFLIVEPLSQGETPPEKRAEEMRKSIKDSVINSRAIRKLEVFPLMAKMAAGLVFGEEGTEQTA
jgi:hypothetical protein